MFLSCGKTGKTLIALSGGVDSAVAAFLLKNQGYEVVGAFLKIWSKKNSRGVCDWKEERRDAYRVAAVLGIPCLTFDFEKEYREQVAKYIYKEYAAGRTPNPDVLCNEKIKFPLLWSEARRRGFDFIATGHHVRKRLRNADGKLSYELLAGADKGKDQSYFLHRLTQNALRHTLFPIGVYTKAEVREIARKNRLPTADKRSTRGICFIGKVKLSDFLSANIAPKHGIVVTADGKKIGTHNGVAPFTIGQRHGLGIGGGTPYYVAAKDAQTETLVVAEENDPVLRAKEIILRNVHWISGQAPEFPLRCRARIRYRSPLISCVVSRKSGTGGKVILVKFSKPTRAPAPGQFVVFYSKEECLGGGVII